MCTLNSYVYMTYMHTYMYNLYIHIYIYIYVYIYMYIDIYYVIYMCILYNIYRIKIEIIETNENGKQYQDFFLRSALKRLTPKEE